MTTNPTANGGSLEAILPQNLRQGLTLAERRLLRAATAGNPALCGPEGDSDDAANDPAKANAWAKAREILGDLMRWLCVNHEAVKRVDPFGVQVGGAKITGGIDLAYTTVPFPLQLTSCALLGDCHFEQITIPSLDLNGSAASEVNAEGAQVSGSVTLNNEFASAGGVRISRATTGGNLDCDSAAIALALWADTAEIRGGVYLRVATSLLQTRSALTSR
jgi:hypothetical protein